MLEVLSEQTYIQIHEGQSLEDTWEDNEHESWWPWMQPFLRRVIGKLPPHCVVLQANYKINLYTASHSNNGRDICTAWRTSWMQRMASAIVRPVTFSLQITRFNLCHRCFYLLNPKHCANKGTYITGRATVLKGSCPWCLQSKMTTAGVTHFAFSHMAGNAECQFQARVNELNLSTLPSSESNLSSDVAMREITTIVITTTTEMITIHLAPIAQCLRKWIQKHWSFQLSTKPSNVKSAKSWLCFSIGFEQSFVSTWCHRPTKNAGHSTIHTRTSIDLTMLSFSVQCARAVPKLNSRAKPAVGAVGTISYGCGRFDQNI